MKAVTKKSGPVRNRNYAEILNVRGFPAELRDMFHDWCQDNETTMSRVLCSTIQDIILGVAPKKNKKTKDLPLVPQVPNNKVLFVRGFPSTLRKEYRAWCITNGVSLVRKTIDIVVGILLSSGTDKTRNKVMKLAEKLREEAHEDN